MRWVHVLSQADHGQSVDTRSDAQLVKDGYEYFGRRVTGTGAERAGAAVNLGGAGTDSCDGVRHRDPEVLMPVEADLCVGSDFGYEGGHALGRLL